MENAIVTQLYSFFIYLGSGVIIAIFFDFFRILRKSFNTPDIVTYIEDIIFWILTGFFLLFVLFQISDGEIRIYNIVGLLIGSVFYILTFSKYFIKINVKIITFIKNIILYPLKLIFKLFKKIFKPFTFFVINIKKILSIPSIKFKKIAEKGKNILRKEGFCK